MACNRLALADFHLGILCALPKEGAAVRASFDRSVPRNEWPTLPHRTTFSYSYGVIGDCHIILGYLADGQYGTVNASALCGDFCHAFGQHVRDVILVGIAGGAPRDGDIRLGDVVVSTRVDEYDFGRAVQAEDGSSTFVVKENVLSLPSTYLASLLSHWRAESLQAHARGLAEEVDHILRSFGSEARASYSRPTVPRRAVPFGRGSSEWMPWLHNQRKSDGASRKSASREYDTLHSAHGHRWYSEHAAEGRKYPRSSAKRTRCAVRRDGGRGCRLQRARHEISRGQRHL